ncbi:MAG TPA: extracellular solute-binding protein [Spongiibacteraceae bacterium]|jgi:putrescine transport system substrate-binding protein|nr:extracellular solute-binding protein [Spongiibacteraceae bacterium]HUH38789.1 extracellular solute-binding protein [Spongiibacteraceae bacterium]
MIIKSMQTLVLGGVMAVSMAVSAQQNVVNVYNWSDYIDPAVLEKFTAETGIKVVYDLFDSNDVLEAKLLASNSGYDVVVPTLSFMARQIKAGVFMELDRSKLPNFSELDPELMARIATVDPGNKHGIPYMWGTTGIGYNVAKVRAALGNDAPLNSWDLVFKPEYISRLAGCGVAMLDAPDEVIPTALNYLGEDPNSEDAKLITGKAKALFMAIRPHITYFHSSKYIDDLANGDICVAVGWSGDILQAAADAAKGVQVAYSIPKEGALLWFDIFGIPRDARNVDNAHAFINFMSRPDIAAANSNLVSYANGVPASKPMINPAIVDNSAIYPPDEVLEKLFVRKMVGPKVDRVYTRTWTEIKTGK